MHACDSSEIVNEKAGYDDELSRFLCILSFVFMHAAAAAAAMRELPRGEYITNTHTHKKT
jgi:hypothetical protein